MARFCVVAPPKILLALKERGENILGYNHLVLAHDIVKRAKEYDEIFNTYNFPSRGIVILDNSVIELGTAVDLGMIAEARLIVRPSCVVLPDVLLEPDITINSCKAALDRWTARLPNASFMMVPQGSKLYSETLREFARCAEHFAEDSRIRFWGVPRNLVARCHTRRDAILILKALNRTRPIHLFGFSDNFRDDIVCANMPEVASIDSAVPLRTPNFSISSIVPPRGDWWETAEYSPEILGSLRRIRRYVGDKT